MTDCVIIHLLGRLEHAGAVAAEFANGRPGSGVVLVSDDESPKPAWAAHKLPKKDLRRAIREKGIKRPALFVLVITNEPAYLKPLEILRALWLSVRLRPEERRVLLHAWSGRYSFAEKAGEVFKYAAGILLRPFYLAALKLLYFTGETVFPLINKKPRKSPLELKDVRKILFISLDLIGDLVWAAPAISAAKKSLPNAEVDLLVNPKTAEIAGLIDGVDRVIAYDAPWFRKLHDPSGTGGRHASRLKNFLTRRKLMSGGYDLTVEFRGEARDHVLAYLTGAPFRAGFTGRSIGAVQTGHVSYLLTHPVPENAEGGGHILKRNLRLTGSLGFNADESNGWLKTSAIADNNLKRLLDGEYQGGDRPLIGIQPGASRPEKRWSKDGFAYVAAGLVEKGVRVALAGSPDEKDLADYIKGRAPGVTDLVGRTGLAEFAALVRACRLFITNETSAISIASAVGTPVLCLMTGVPELYGPYGVRCAVLQKRLDCWNPVGEHCFCPYGYKCLQEITPEEVLEAARGLLSP